jgi:hypothetical protein
MKSAMPKRRHTERAKLLEERIGSPLPSAWKGSAADWLSFCHLNAGLGFYRASVSGIWWRTREDPEYEDAGRKEVDVRDWTVGSVRNVLFHAPFMAAWIEKRLTDDHPSSPPSALDLLVGLVNRFRQLPVGLGLTAGHEIGEIDPSGLSRAKTHFEWVLDHSGELLYQKLARVWMTRMLNDITRWEGAAESIVVGQTRQIPDLDARQWLDALNVGFPRAERQSKWLSSGG